MTRPRKNPVRQRESQDILIVMMMSALKGANRYIYIYFFTISSVRRELSPTRTTKWPAAGNHGGRRPSNDDSFHSPTVIPPSALDKPSIMKRYHRQRMCSHTSPRRSPTMIWLHDTGFVECRWWNDSWTENCRHLTVVGLHDTGPRTQWCANRQ